MRTTIDIATLAGSAENEDRAGASGALAWVVDGATDVIEAPLTSSPTDASWFADILDHALRQVAPKPPANLTDLPAILAEQVQAAFQRAALRRPEGRHEHPSASGIIVRTQGNQLDYVAIGDCSLLVTTSDGGRRIGVDEDDAGDPWVADAITAFRAENTEASSADARAHLWPKLAAGRAAMNEPGGYGVFSITQTPSHFIRSGSQPIIPGGHVLLASDGLMRLVDVFRHYAPDELLDAVVARGVASLTKEVRALEDADAECITFPRAKCHDDATGLLISFTS